MVNDANGPTVWSYGPRNKYDPALTTQPWRCQWIRQFDYSSRDWVQLNALTRRVTLLRKFMGKINIPTQK